MRRANLEKWSVLYRNAEVNKWERGLEPTETEVNRTLSANAPARFLRDTQREYSSLTIALLNVF